MDEVYKTLVEGIKEVCMKPDCPKWVSEKLKKTVIKAKKIKEENKGNDAVENIILNRPPVVGDRVRNKDKKDNSLYQIESLSYVIEGVQLYNVRIIEGDNCGEIIHNVPFSKFQIIG